MADTAESSQKRVVLIVAKRGGLVLFGKRRDNGRWTLPGGSVEDGETDSEAALRELSEETNLSPVGALEPIDERTLGNLKITTFECEVDGAPNGKKDPDRECELYAFFDLRDGVPKAVARNMAGPKDPEENVTADLYGLAKMAIADIPPGQRMPEPARRGAWYDYNHVLPEHLRGDYTLRVKDDMGGEGGIHAQLRHKTLGDVGYVTGETNPRNPLNHNLYVDESRVHEPHRGKGLGTAMYEALYAHAFHNGIKKVYGNEHSTSASATHQKLAAKHGMDYKPRLTSEGKRAKPAPYDDRFGPYSYDLKSELELTKVEGDPLAHLRSDQARHLGAQHIPCDEGEDPFHVGGCLTWAHAAKDALGHGAQIYTFTQPTLDGGREEAGHAVVLHNGRFHDSAGSYSDENGAFSAAGLRREGSVRGKGGARLEPRDAFLAKHPDGEGLVYHADLHRALSGHPMTKTEEADEVDRLLLHSDPTERSMALKLHGVKGKHLVRAFQDADEGVQRAALRHPALDGNALLSLMQMPDRAKLQLSALQHPRIDRRAVEALYHTAKSAPLPERAELLHAVSHHDLVDSPLIERMHAEGNGQALVENLRTPGRVLDQIVEDHLSDPQHPEKRALARRALKHPAVSTHLVERAWKEGPADVKIAVAQSRHLPEALAQDTLVRGQRPDGDGEALLRSFIINNPKATQQHLETASRDRNPLVRHAARARLGQVAKFEDGLGAFLGEQLAKATRPKDFAGVLRASDPKGSDVVDHEAELNAHPPENNPDVAAYRQAVLESPETLKRSGTSSREGSDGVTRKLLYTLPASHPTHGGVRFMVKPYHERILRRNKKRMAYPYQGWAEMTNQALYHAGGVGHLHQNVHVSQHDMGPGHEKDPALVVRMDPGWKTISDVPWDGQDWPEHAKSQGRQIGIMDFLTQNMDRHDDNLMYHPEKGLLAIDHPRSFQYRDGNGPKWSAGPDEARDRFSWYVNNNSALGGLAPVPGNGRNGYEPGLSGNLKAIQDWQPAFDWWGDNGPAIRDAFNKRLALIKDPEARAHLARNFHSRADWLDQRAHMGLANHGQDWYNDTARVYRPGELTDDEREAAFHPEE